MAYFSVCLEHWPIEYFNYGKLNKCRLNKIPIPLFISTINNSGFSGLPHHNNTQKNPFSLWHFLKWHETRHIIYILFRTLLYIVQFTQSNYCQTFMFQIKYPAECENKIQTSSHKAVLWGFWYQLQQERTKTALDKREESLCTEILNNKKHTGKTYIIPNILWVPSNRCTT